MLSWRFDPAYKLGPDDAFKLAFNVTETKKAKEQYKKGGYLHKGDADTDCDPGENITSSGKEGFYSNHKATLKYNQDSEEKTMEYQKPVVQVHLMYKLPSTGHPLGTWFYTILGSAILFIAADLILRRKRDIL